MIHRHLGVRYVYEKPEQKLKVAESQEQISDLPSELLDNLEQVTIRLNAEMINKAIEAIRPHNAALANTLASSAESFKYSIIQRY